MAYRTVIPRCPRQQEGITTADTSAHGPLRHSMATSRNRAGRPEQSPAIRVHTEVLALAGRAIAPGAVAALARQQRSSRSVASHHHSLTPPGKHRRSDGTRGPACQPLNRVILLDTAEIGRVRNGSASVNTGREAPPCRGRGAPGRQASGRAIEGFSGSWEVHWPIVQVDPSPGRLWAVGRWGALRTTKNQRERFRRSRALPRRAGAGPNDGADELACKPDPVPGRLAALRSATIHLGPPSPAGSSGLPADSDGPPSNACAALRSFRLESLLTLLRVGFTEPPRSPGALVVSYTTVSPLPRSRGAVCFLWHCPAGHPGLPLATTLPCGVRTFLGSMTRVPTSRR